MNGPFKLLVAAIVTVALLWFFFAYLTPFFTSQKDPFPLVLDGLRLAKITPGLVVSKGPIEYPSGFVVRAAGLSEKGSDTIISCNSPLFCCDQGKHCANKIYWTHQQALVVEKNTVPTFARCKQGFDVFACMVFLGKKPAQVEIENLVFEKNLNLQTSSEWKLIFSAKNAGSENSQEGTARLDLFDRQTAGPTRTVFSDEKTIPALKPGESTDFEWKVPIMKDGSFEAVIRIESDNAGYAEKKAAFSAHNNPTVCRALLNQATEKIFDAQKQECTEKFFCENCQTATECKQQWQQAQPAKTFEIGDKTFAQIRTTTTVENCE